MSRYYATKISVVLDRESPVFLLLEKKAAEKGWSLEQTIEAYAGLGLGHHIKGNLELDDRMEARKNDGKRI